MVRKIQRECYYDLSKVYNHLSKLYRYSHNKIISKPEICTTTIHDKVVFLNITSSWNIEIENAQLGYNRLKKSFTKCFREDIHQLFGYSHRKVFCPKNLDLYLVFDEMTIRFYV